MSILSHYRTNFLWHAQFATNELAWQQPCHATMKTCWKTTQFKLGGLVQKMPPGIRQHMGHRYLWWPTHCPPLPALSLSLLTHTHCSPTAFSKTP